MANVVIGGMGLDADATDPAASRGVLASAHSSRLTSAMIPRLTRLFALLLFTVTLRAAEPVRIGCMGDSLTAGAKVNAATESYPAQLQQMLGAGFVVKNFGKGGATLWHGGKPNAFEELAGVTEFAPHVVVVAFGTNDTRSRDVAYWSHAGEFDAELTKLLDTLAALPSKPRVVLCYAPAIQADLPGMTPEIHDNRAERQPRLAELRTKIHAIASARGLAIVDFFTPTEKHPELYADDGVHLNAAGYRVMAEAVRGVVTSKQ